MASTDRPAFNRLLPPAGAIVVAIAVAAIVLLLPQAALESIAWNTGIAGMIPAAAPPLGATARMLLAVGLAVFAGAVAWSILFLLWGPGGFLVRARGDGDRVVVRRADAHPDAPPRRPISAESDFGAPPPAMPPLERSLPADLDQPLAGFDPLAIPPVPQTPAEPVPPLAKLSPRLAPERVETFERKPIPVATEPPPPPAPPATIETLLRRLEEGAVRRAARDAE